MEFEFAGEVWYWRGPSPFHFVTVPPDASEQIHELSSLLTYGWGVIPVTAQIGETTWTTSLFPRDAGYALPLRASVRSAQDVTLGDVVRVTMRLDVSL